MKKLLSLSILTTLIFSGCSKYGNVVLKYPTAPAVIIADNIHRIAIVNRSLTKKDDKNPVLESVLSGEIAGSDKIASDECLKGVEERMVNSNQFTIVIPKTTRLYGTGTRETPELLDWNQVKQICTDNNADALLVLETFDSNSNILENAVANGVNAVVNGTNPASAAALRQVRMNVLCFWRLYDPVNQKIIDQYQSTSWMNFDAGSGIVAIPPPDALPKTAYFAGQEYIRRFLPNYYNVRRDLYKRGKGADKQQFLTAFRKSEVADWEGALQVWEVLAKSTNRTNAGRACLDVAVAYEVLGKTSDALAWAKKAYEDYGNKMARTYQNQLSYRMKMEY